jgi:hypothetical protein
MRLSLRELRFSQILDFTNPDLTSVGPCEFGSYET